MIEIVPSIIAKTKEEFLAAVQKLEPHTERVHFDVLDGAFASGETIRGYDEIGSLQTKLKFDVHLMVMHPQEYVPQWLMLAQVDRVAISAESEGQLGDVLLQIRSQGKKAGIVLNPETPTASILELLPMVDYVQFMTVHPGSYGRPFLTDVVEKILNFHDAHSDVVIAVDGGMNPETARLVIGAGASIIVSGSYVIGSADIPKAIAELAGRTLDFQS